MEMSDNASIDGYNVKKKNQYFDAKNRFYRVTVIFKTVI